MQKYFQLKSWSGNIPITLISLSLTYTHAQTHTSTPRLILQSHFPWSLTCVQVSGSWVSKDLWLLYAQPGKVDGGLRLISGLWPKKIRLIPPQVFLSMPLWSINFLPFQWSCSERQQQALFAAPGGVRMGQCASVWVKAVCLGSSLRIRVNKDS